MNFLFISLPKNHDSRRSSNAETRICSDYNGANSLSRVHLYPPLYVALDGSVLKPDVVVAIGVPKDSYSVLTGGPMTGVELSELPASVINVIRQRAPGAEVATITKETSGGQVVYVIDFKDAFYPKLYVQADGTVIKETR